MTPPWYATGLRFQCQQCGRCCAGEPGYVWVDSTDIQRMSTALGMSTSAFRRQHLRAVGGRTCLLERPDHDCCLLHPTDRTCQVYEARPAQCRVWPWWPENLTSPQRWRACACACPGIGRGPVHPLATIEGGLRAAPPPLPPRSRLDPASPP